MMRAPRCGRPLRRHEPVSGPPVIESPSCGRPEGHRGPCRSPRSLAKARRAATERQAALTRPCVCGCGEMALWGHRYRHGHNERRADGVWTSAPSRPEMRAAA